MRRAIGVAAASVCAACLGAILLAQPDAVQDSGEGRETLLNDLRENVRQHEQYARSLAPLYQAGRVPKDEVREAELRVATARALEARVLGDLEPQREALRLRITLNEERLAEWRSRADETDPGARLSLLQDLSEARVRLWELDHRSPAD